jgi:hypothetical protein
MHSFSYLLFKSEARVTSNESRKGTDAALTADIHGSSCIATRIRLMRLLSMAFQIRRVEIESHVILTQLLNETRLANGLRT